MINLLALFISAQIYASPSQLSVYIGSDTKRSEGGAYIIRSFVLDQTEYNLDSTEKQQIEAIYWYPSGKIKAYTSTGQSISIGQSKPIYHLAKSNRLLYYFPSDVSIKQRDEVINTGTSLEGLSYRNLRSKALIALPRGENIFLESTQTQILQNGDWTTP